MFAEPETSNQRITGVPVGARGAWRLAGQQNCDRALLRKDK
jgi:hypothetical protein